MVLHVGILLTLFVSTNFEDIISIRIAIGSGTAFLVAQLVDIEIFQRLRNNAWFIAPMTSSVFGSIIDTFLFFSISFLGTGTLGNPCFWRFICKTFNGYFNVNTF